jgi:hypothetical protein
LCLSLAAGTGVSLTPVYLGHRILTLWIYTTILSRSSSQASQRCLTPIILATWEAEIRRSAVQGQPGEKKFARPHLKQ